MAQTEAAIIEQIHSIVAEKLQVVSYKWLSRNFSVSSNAAKRLLEEFVEKYGNGLEVIYSLSGWLKSNPSTYHIHLVPKHKLSDAMQKFDGNCSMQVYSVQSCLPKDPATLWNHEFAQAEDLFNQKSTVDNCFWDNRFCGVSNSYVQRTRGESHLIPGSVQIRSTLSSDLHTSSHHTMVDKQPVQKKVLQASSKAGSYVPNDAATVKTETVKHEPESAAKVIAGKGKTEQWHPRNKNGLQNKSCSGTGGGLAGIWDRATAKSRCDAHLQNPTESETSAHESVESEGSDEEAQDFNVKRTSVGKGSRKRIAVFDDSDEEDGHKDAVTLASPDTKGVPLSSEQNSKCSDLDCYDDENKHEINEVMETKTNQHPEENPADISRNMPEIALSSAKAHAGLPVVSDAVTKRRKVVSRIDARGREVTEVFWEGEEPGKEPESTAANLSESKGLNNGFSRPPVTKKSPAVGSSAPANPGGKTGSKKIGGKDPKQGNITSFFKKV